MRHIVGQAVIACACCNKFGVGCCGRRQQRTRGGCCAVTRLPFSCEGGVVHNANRPASGQAPCHCASLLKYCTVSAGNRRSRFHAALPANQRSSGPIKWPARITPIMHICGRFSTSMGKIGSFVHANVVKDSRSSFTRLTDWQTKRKLCLESYT